MTMKLANDLGNSVVKATFGDNYGIEFPSVIAVQQPQNIGAPVTFDDEQQQTEYMNHFMDHLDASISSSAVKLQGRFFVGPAAVESQLPLSSFDLNDFGGKADDDLSLILTLSMIAGKRVMEAVVKGEDLAETLNVKVKMATALPIAEGKRQGVREAYQKRYLDQSHTVIFHNFKNPITVKVTFEQVFVALEGEVAQFYIKYAPEKLLKVMMKDLQQNYPDVAEIVTMDDIKAVQNALGVDIGGKTVDIASVVNGQVNTVASSSMWRGYATVLQNAIEVLQSQQMNFDNPVQLNDFLSRQVSPFAQGHQERVRKIVYEQLEPFADQIVEEVSKDLRQAGARPELFFVYGGGSIPMGLQSNLRAKLVEKIRHFNGGDDIPVIWIDQEFAQGMNLRGLELVLKSMGD